MAIEDTGGQVGSATWEGDLIFTVIPQPVQIPPPAYPPPALINKVTGSFRATFTTNATVNPIPVSGGVQTGLKLTGQGSAVGNLMGDYDPQSNTIDITGWLSMLTQANGTWTTGIGGTNPGPSTKPWSVDVPATPVAPGNPPPSYGIPQGEVTQASAIGEPGVLTPEVPDPEVDAPTLTLSLNNVGEQQVTQTASGSAGEPVASPYTETITWTFNLVPPKYTIDVQYDPPELDPVIADAEFTSTMTITVTENGQPSQNRDVDITVCTEIGGPGTDGHLHDSRSDPCDSSRPPGSIDGSNKYNPPITKVTDGTGKITAQYTPPEAQNPLANSPRYTNGPYYISGIDDIKVVVGDPTITDKTGITDKQSVKTWVQNLEPIAGSPDTSGQALPSGMFPPGPGGTGYQFPASGQSNHGNLYYGTQTTNQTIIAIANEFNAAQLACQNGEVATYGQNAQGENFYTPGSPKPIIITAMSLPWGGLSDINGDWNPGHGSHNSGTVVDIGFAEFAIGTGAQGNMIYDMDRLLLLKSVIVATAGENFGNFPQNEGGDMSLGGLTLSSNQPHFHVRFNQ